MARHGRDNYGSNIGDMTVGDYANGMPNIRLGEMFRSFGRQLRWVIPLFIAGVVLAYFLTKDIKRTYEGVGSVIVKQGPEHTFTSVTGDQGAAIMQGPEAITELESAVMKSNTVIEAVTGDMTDQFGEERFNKSAYEKINNAEARGDKVGIDNGYVELFKSVEKAFWVQPRAKAGVIDVTFKHEDPEIAVETLKALLFEYQDTRKTIFVDGSADVFGKQVTAIEEQLRDVESKIQRFLEKNDISEFNSEREGASERTQALRAEMNELRAQMSGTEAELAAVESQLRNTTEVIDTEINDMGSQRVAQANLELQQLLAKYLPDSNPVRIKQAEIAELKALQTANGGNPIGRRTVGPNPTHQALVAQRNTLMATADSLREREFTLTQLLGSNDSKVKKIRKLSPAYNNLLRERETLDLRLKGVNSKYQEALVNQAQAAVTNSENIKVIEPTLARKGRNMAKIMFALISIGWGFTLFMLALLKVFLDPRLYSDPTRRMRARPEVQAYASDEWGSDVPYRNPAQPYVPEPVPVQPAAAQYAAQPAAQYNDPYATPAPYQAQPYQAPAAPYATNFQDPNVDPYGNPYAAPGVQAAPLGTGALPTSETG